MGPHAVETDLARIALALLIGFLLAAPWETLAWKFPVSVVGNLIGGLGFVTLARRLQARAEPNE